MNYHGMPPEDHLKFMFNANVELTGRVRTRIQDLQPYIYSDVAPVDMTSHIEREVSITMGERDYDNFKLSYGKYLDLVYAAERDPVVKDMMEKMLMYIILKR